MQNILSKDTITIISKSWCPFCIRAKNTLDSAKLRYKNYEVDQNELDSATDKQMSN